jgi:cell wall-associated NlpC family hydrolase
MRRLAVTAAALAALAAAPAATAAPSWAKPEIQKVVAAGLLAPSVREFRADDALVRRELGEVLAAIRQEAQVVVDPERPVTVRELDAALVKLLGLAPAARAIRSAAAAAGLKPSARLGTETVARLLDLRTNHPASDDGRELLPNDAVTRAETAYSLARVLELSDWDLGSVNELASSFALPELSDWQRKVLDRALLFVGYPYIWGGASERPEAPFGVQSRGGFDCSGFVWRVYKLEPFAGAPGLASVLRGRTTYQMSGEVRRAARVPAAELQPGDVMFFGARGPRSKPAQVDHMGIYVGNGWFVHSSGRGTTLHPFSGWYESSFAWGRRPLAEAGLA